MLNVREIDMKVSTKRLKDKISGLEVLVQSNRIVLPKEMEKEDLNYFSILLNGVIGAMNYFDTEIDLYIEREKEDAQN
jgi:hypothetical protein